MKIILILFFLFILYIIYNNKKDNFTNSNKLDSKKIPWNDNSNKKLNVNEIHCGNTQNLFFKDSNNILMAYNYDNIYDDDTNDVSNFYSIVKQKYGKDNDEIINAVSSSKPLHFSLVIKHENNNYNLLGYAINKYYQQYYIIYEFKITQNDNYYLKDNLDYVNNQLYKYVLVKTKENTLKIIHAFGPRNKINIGDIVNLSYGVYQLGPLEIMDYK